MTPRDFIYWLQGFLEVENPDSIDAEKTKIIKEHLALCFEKESYGLEEILTKAKTVEIGRIPINTGHEYKECPKFTLNEKPTRRSM